LLAGIQPDNGCEMDNRVDGLGCGRQRILIKDVSFNYPQIRAANDLVKRMPVKKELVQDSDPFACSEKLRDGAGTYVSRPTSHQDACRYSHPPK
jgi:hypothetical protein